MKKKTKWITDYDIGVGATCTIFLLVGLIFGSIQTVTVFVTGLTYLMLKLLEQLWKNHKKTN